MAQQVEVGRSDIRVGDTLVSKADNRRSWLVEEISTGVNGHGWPYLVMMGSGGRVEHDTSFDSNSATYTVQR